MITRLKVTELIFFHFFSRLFLFTETHESDDDVIKPFQLGHKLWFKRAHADNPSQLFICLRFLFKAEPLHAALDDSNLLPGLRR